MLGPQDKQPEVKKEEKPEVPVETGVLVRPASDEELDKIVIARSLGLEEYDQRKKHDRRLAALVEWAKRQGAQTQVDILGKFNQLRNRLGNKTIYDYAVYACLEMDRIALQEQTEKVSGQMKQFEYGQR